MNGRCATTPSQEYHFINREFVHECTNIIPTSLLVGKNAPILVWLKMPFHRNPRMGFLLQDSTQIEKATYHSVHQ